MADVRKTSLSPSGSRVDEARVAVLARNWWALALRGVIAIVFGLVALFLPVAAMLSLALVFGAYLLVDGIFGILSVIRAAQANERWGLLLAEAILNILMGALALVFPISAVLAFVIITAAWALLTGALMLAAAFKLDPERGKWWMVLAGVVSLLFGIALAIAPLIGAVVLTWWVGAYAVVFGIALLILAFRLRARQARSQQAA
jgi:uncharacterized membrane protein HdeD (DUF308 family)